MVFKPAPISAEPFLECDYWAIYEVEGKNNPKTRHIVGLVNGIGRVSSPIVSFNEKTVITSTGRKYQLIGPSRGIKMDAGFVFGEWCSIHETTNWTDISNEYT